MAWQYSDPLNGALLAAQKNNQSDLGLSNQFQPLFSNYDPLLSRYQPRATFFDRTPASINIFDDIDDFDLEVETDSLLSARYRVPDTVYKQPAYVPSYFSKASNDYDSNTDNYKNALSNRSLNVDNYKLPLKESPNPYSNAFKPMPFDLRSTPPSSFKSDNSYPPSINSSDPQNHNSTRQRFIQYQQRLLQDKEHHIKKQYSETSIPSTNADPLNSNSPTPPMLNQKSLKQKDNKLAKSFADNVQPTQNSNFYYKLNENGPKKYATVKDKYTTSDYKKYQNNFGFGQNFLPFETLTKEEKQERAKKKQEYSKKINAQNLVKASNINGQRNTRNNNDTYTNDFDVSKRNGNFKVNK